MRKQNIIWLIFILALPVLACNLSGQDKGSQADLATPTSAVHSEPTAEGNEAGPQADQATAATAPAEAEVVEEKEAAKEEKAEAGKADTGAKSGKFTGVTGLEQMSAYRVKFVMDFDGTSGDKPAKGHIGMTLEQTKTPPARHLAMSMEGTTMAEMGGSNGIELYQVEDKVYMKNTAMGEQWMSFSGDQAESFEQGFFAPDKQLELPKTAQCAEQPETINGLAATHCTFNEKDVVDEKVTYESLQGDVWVAAEGNYIIKFTLKADGYRPKEKQEGDLFDFGTVGFEYEVSDVNGDFTITVPEAALKGMSMGETGGGTGQTGQPPSGDIPMLDDAQEVTSMAGFATYYTASEIKQVVDFYRQKLPAEGWQEDASKAYTDDTNAILSFTKEGKTLQLTVIKEDNRTNVIVTVQ